MMESAMIDETRNPKDDPVEGSREVIDADLQEQASKQDQKEKKRDRQRPLSHPPREDKELGPKGVP
jgi:hypothetical protein